MAPSTTPQTVNGRRNPLSNQMRANQSYPVLPIINKNCSVIFVRSRCVHNSRKLQEICLLIPIGAAILVLVLTTAISLPPIKARQRTLKLSKLCAIKVLIIHTKLTILKSNSIASSSIKTLILSITKKITDKTLFTWSIVRVTTISIIVAIVVAVP